MGLIRSKLASCLTVRAAGNSTILGRVTTVPFEAAVETVSDSIAGPAELDFATGRCAKSFPVALDLLADSEAILSFSAGLADLLATLTALLGLLPGLAVEVPLFLACVVPGVDDLVPSFLAVVWVARLFFDASELLAFSLPAAFGLAAGSLLTFLLVTVFFTDWGGWAAPLAFPPTLPFDARPDDFSLFFFPSSLS